MECSRIIMWAYSLRMRVVFWGENLTTSKCHMPFLYFSFCNSEFSHAIFLLFLMETKIIRSTQIEVLSGPSFFSSEDFIKKNTVLNTPPLCLLFSHTPSLPHTHTTYLVLQLEAMIWFSAFERLGPHRSFGHSPSLNSFSLSVRGFTLCVRLSIFKTFDISSPIQSWQPWHM